MNTFAMVKPGSVKRGELIQVLEFIGKTGFKVDNMRQHTLLREEAEFLYSDHRGKPFFDELIEHTVSGPAVLLELCFDDNPADTIERWRAAIGPTNPDDPGEPVEWLRANPLRYRLGCTGGPDNGVHGSADAEAAKRELEYFFPSLS